MSRERSLEYLIFSLPVRMGGIGIDNPVMTTDHEFEASTLMTNNLTNIIYSTVDKRIILKTMTELRWSKSFRTLNKVKRLGSSLKHVIS